MGRGRLDDDPHAGGRSQLGPRGAVRAVAGLDAGWTVSVARPCWAAKPVTTSTTTMPPSRPTTRGWPRFTAWHRADSRIIAIDATAIAPREVLSCRRQGSDHLIQRKRLRRRGRWVSDHLNTTRRRVPVRRPISSSRRRRDPKHKAGKYVGAQCITWPHPSNHGRSPPIETRFGAAPRAPRR